MCRMMGVVSRGPVYYDLFEEFADLATQGMCPLGAPDARGHKDGWGLACFQNGSLKWHMRDAGCAADAAKYYGTAWKIAKLNMERASRSEEHTSELQSQSNLVCRLLLEKKKITLQR